MKYLLTIIILSFSIISYSQNDNLHVGSGTLESSAIIQADANDRGVLIPRMTTTEKNAITSPATGLLVYDNTSSSFWYYDSSQWVELGAGGSSGTSSLIADSDGDTKVETEASPDEDFIRFNIENNERLRIQNTLFKLTAVSILEGSSPYGSGGKFFYDASKKAFRVGNINSVQWDQNNIGIYSFATGQNTTANGLASVALGIGTSASGIASFAFGGSATASGVYAAAWGSLSEASGQFSTSFGSSTAAGDHSLAFGYATEANANAAVAWGNNTRAEGLASTTWGQNTIADGKFATSIGVYTKAPSYAETTLGIYSTDYGATDDSTWEPNDRIFSVGNGKSTTERDNAIVITKSGTIYTGIDTSGASNRLVWMPHKGAFRAGTAGAITWDENRIGEGSTSFGVDNTSLGQNSMTWGNQNNANSTNATAIGFDCTASNVHSLAAGFRTLASGSTATALGNQTVASGSSALALGQSTLSSGVNSFSSGQLTQSTGRNSMATGLFSKSNGYASFAAGYNSTAHSYSEFVIGQNNEDYTPANALSWNFLDKLFVIGNGSSSTNKNDALVVYKSGNTVLRASELKIVNGVTDADIIIDGKTGTNSVEFREDGAFKAGIGWDANTDRVFIYQAGNALFAKDGKIGIGNQIPVTNALEVNGEASKTMAGSWAANSDMRLKKNISKIPSENALSKIMAMRGVTYEWDDDKTGIDRPEGTHIGFIAQDLQVLFPEKVKEDNNGYLMTAYGDYDPIFVEAIKAQQAQIELLQQETAKLKAENIKLNSALNEINSLKERIVLIEKSYSSTKENRTNKE